jgi:hypothetical protein
MHKIKISNKSMKLKFHGCDYDYIKSTCHSKCCDSTKYGTLITIHPSEEMKISNLGVQVNNGLLVAGKTCPFKVDYLCSLHDTESKPFGCIASPFTLNKNDTLIVRNRYKMLKCYPGGVPAYVAFRSSLDLFFGVNEADMLCNRIETSNNDIFVGMNDNIYNMLKDNDTIKQRFIHGQA